MNQGTGALTGAVAAAWVGGTTMSAPLATIPEGLDVFATDEGMVIRRGWRTWMIVPAAIFALVWDAFLVFWYSMAFGKGDVPWIVVVFPIGHVAVGIGITYWVMCSLVNRTDIVVSQNGVRVFTGPMPWPGNKSVPAGEISEVLVRERSGNRGAKTFDVMYADLSRKERRLVKVDQTDKAAFIAQAIRVGIGLKAD